MKLPALDFDFGDFIADEAPGQPVSARSQRAGYEAVAAKQDAGDDRAALTEAIRWLLAAAAKVRKNNPPAAPAMYRKLTDQVVDMAEEISSGGGA